MSVPSDALKKTVNGVQTKHIYDGMNIVADIGAETKVYFRGNDLVKQKNKTTNTSQTYYTGHRGDVFKVANTDGTYKGYIYAGYGDTVTTGADVSNPFAYCGEYTDAETGLVYLRNRYYDPTLGVFTTEDPIKDGLNWYAYCSGNPIRYIDPRGLTYIIAWSYGMDDDHNGVNDLEEHYTNRDGTIDWSRFTKENSFARAAYTKKQELINNGVPESEIDIQRIDNEEDLKSTWKMWAEYDLVEGLDIYSHGYSGGISVAGGGGEYISNTTKLNWGSKIRTRKVNGEPYPVRIAPYTVFHGCNTAKGSFAQEYANTQEVTTYAQVGYASFSQSPTTHIPIKDRATKGNVYLYHFNWNNLINTYGSGKAFYKE